MYQLLGEGNANLVVKYTDTQVLRLSKQKPPSIKYSKSLSECLGETYSVHAEDMELDQETIKNILEHIRLYRTRSGDSIHGCVLMDNLALNDGRILVEIKPKWGFLPSEYAPTCRFCLHSQLKSASLYCPLDLYSNHIPRMEHAIASLISTPNNNLSMRHRNQLLPPYHGSKVFEEYFGRPMSTVLAQILFHDPILQRLKHWQQRFHHNITLLDLNDEIDHLLTRNVASVLDGSYRGPHLSSLQHLLSMTFKDLSLMIAIKKDPTDGFIALDDLYYQIKAVDLDQKSIRNLSKQLVLEQQLQSLPKNKTCIPSPLTL
ncbi:inositol-pentakisphosphate 2-kinase [Gorgonomyces haynaldii]|nr:inositol-pentakisphosphate 2-kinase [Gorgonomyces haynaldii]